MARYCLTDSRPAAYGPGTMSRVTTALPPFGQWVQGQISLSIAFQAIPPHVLEDNRENDADAMRKCLFPVYRLAVDARPVGWWWSGLKISELAQGFSDGYAINGSQRHLHQAQGVYLGFCESVLQQKTQGVDFGFCQSYKICENLWEPSNRPATGQATAIFALQIYRISTTKRFPHVGNIFRIRNIF